MTNMRKVYRHSFINQEWHQMMVGFVKALESTYDKAEVISIVTALRDSIPQDGILDEAMVASYDRVVKFRSFLFSESAIPPKL